MNPEKLQYGKFYHIYSHGVGYRNVFKEPANYEFFMHVYERYIMPIADTYAWVLMPNHVHFVVRIKTEENIALIPSDRVPNPVRGKVSNPVRGKVPNPVRGENKNNKPLKIGTPSQQFSKVFNAYAQAFNKWTNTRGSLFERPFKRKLVENIHYLKNLVLYIHNNPIHHGFCDHPLGYPWSSYLSCVSIKPTNLKRDELIGWFDGAANFKTKHGAQIDFRDLEAWLDI